MATARYGRAEAMPPGVQAKGPHHNAVHVQARGPHHNGGATLGLDTPVQFLTGVGPARAQAFGALGVQTVGDLIEHFPFRYELTPKSVPIGALRLGEKATIIGAITGVRSGGPGRAVVAHVVDATGRIRVRWFNAPYMEQRLGRGQTVRVSGTVEMYRDEAQFVNPRLEFIDPDRDPFEHDMDAFEPVYPAGAGLTSRQIAALIRRALAQVGDALPEFLPDTVRRARQLPPRATAIQRYHRPTQADDVQIARRRLAYDEFLILQLAVQLRRQFRKQHASA
ncbi:MAG TPA: OB-fold nucleic acid binding domain-containing protein, partial [Phycisphaerae bacterium]